MAEVVDSSQLAQKRAVSANAAFFQCLYIILRNLRFLSLTLKNTILFAKTYRLIFFYDQNHRFLHVFPRYAYDKMQWKKK